MTSPNIPVPTVPVEPTTKLAVATERTAVNDELTTALANLGWNADSEEDYEWLNEITHQVADAIDPA